MFHGLLCYLLIKDSICNSEGRVMKVLSLDGGGYLGLASAAFIAESERHFRCSFHSEFDFFCGTSTGSIIALALASGMSGEQVKDLYIRFGKEVFRNSFPCRRIIRKFVGLGLSMYGNRRLKIVLDDVFGSKTLGDVLASGKRVLVPAYCITTGQPRIFKTDHAPGLSGHGKYRLSDIALASSAAPYFLPLVKLTSPTSGVSERFCDGGVFANCPDLLAYAEAVGDLGVVPQEVSILSIATPRADLAERPSSTCLLRRWLDRRGIVIWRDRLFQVFIDGNAASSRQVIKRLSKSIGFRYLRFDFCQSPGLEMDVATKATTETLLALGSELSALDGSRKSVEEFLRKG
jgi:predicted acylesterase/phospholipase RssA